MHLKESYQRTMLVITAFSEDDVIVTSGGPDNDSTNNNMPVLGPGGIPSGGSKGMPGAWV